MVGRKMDGVRRGLGVLLGMGLAGQGAIAQVAPAQSAADGTQPVVLGQPCTHPYIVAIPATDPTLIDRVHALIPTAVMVNSHLGAYVQAASAPERSPLTPLIQELRAQGFDARMVYRPILCSAPEGKSLE